MQRKTFHILWVLCLVFCSCATTSEKKLSKTEKARIFVEAANGALNEGDVPGALTYLNQAQELDPRIPELYHAKALAFFLRHELRTAAHYAEEAVKLKPNYSEAANTLGKILIDLDEFKQAEPYLIHAARDPLNRESYKARTNLGILYYKLGSLTQSAAQFNLAIESAPQLACVAYYYRGQIRAKDGDLSHAIMDYEQSTQRFCAEFPEAQMALGMAYQKNSAFDKARKKFLEVQQTYPNTAYADQAMAHLKEIP